MGIKDILGSSGGVVVILMTLLEISPIKINPWRFIWSCISRVFKKGIELLNSPTIEQMKAINSKLDSMSEQHASLVEKVNLLEYKETQKDAVYARNRILAFGDDLMHGVLHSQPSYDQVMMDITSYNEYCRAHPEFKNNITSTHATLIQKRYMTHLDNNDFLQ